MLLNALIVAHFAFVFWVVVGGVVAAVYVPWVLWFHIPALVWAVLVEAMDWPCPLTQLENILRQRLGWAAIQTGFVDHYILRSILSAKPVRGLEQMLTALLLAMNLVAYAVLWLL